MHFRKFLPVITNFFSQRSSDTPLPYAGALQLQNSARPAPYLRSEISSGPTSLVVAMSDAIQDSATFCLPREPWDGQEDASEGFKDATNSGRTEKDTLVQSTSQIHKY